MQAALVSVHFIYILFIASLNILGFTNKNYIYFWEICDILCFDNVTL